MKAISSIVIFVKVLLFMMVWVAITNCAGKEDILTPATSAELGTEAEMTEVPNYTVSGSYTEYVESVDCATCTYIVPSGTVTVDGTELDLKPGSVICLNKASEYKSLEFVNLEGTADSPIVIGQCGE